MRDSGAAARLLLRLEVWKVWDMQDLPDPHLATIRNRWCCAPPMLRRVCVTRAPPPDLFYFWRSGRSGTCKIFQTSPPSHHPKPVALRTSHAETCLCVTRGGRQTSFAFVGLEGLGHARPSRPPHLATFRNRWRCAHPMLRRVCVTRGRPPDFFCVWRSGRSGTCKTCQTPHLATFRNR